MWYIASIGVWHTLPIWLFSVPCHLAPEQNHCLQSCSPLFPNQSCLRGVSPVSGLQMTSGCPSLASTCSLSSHNTTANWGTLLQWTVIWVCWKSHLTALKLWEVHIGHDCWQIKQLFLPQKGGKWMWLDRKRAFELCFVWWVDLLPGQQMLKDNWSLFSHTTQDKIVWWIYHSFVNADDFFQMIYPATVTILSHIISYIQHKLQ